MEPQRVQLRRTKGWKIPPNTVIVDRRTKWGNPWSPKNHHVITKYGVGILETRPATILECVASYRDDMKANKFKLDVRELRGKNLACWCPIGSPCHADVLLELANPRPQGRSEW